MMPHNLDDGIELSLTIPEDLDGKRLDAAIAALAGSAYSRARIQGLIAEGHLKSNGKIITRGASKVVCDTEYSLTIPPAAPAEPVAQDIEINIVYEDEYMLVINKAAGMVVHPAVGHADGTLVNALLAHCGEQLSGIGGVKRPGIVHRLDKDTTGLMVVAKNDLAHKHLSAQLSERTLKRVYQTLVWGAPSPVEGTIDARIGRSSSNRKKMAVLEHGGKDAVTDYTVEHIIGQAVASVVECRLHTGRTHQIRVHMAHIGHWIVGDPTYRPNSFKRLRRGHEDIFNLLHKFPRQALHAKELCLTHPKTGEEMRWSAPLPEDMQNILLACTQQSCSIKKVEKTDNHKG